MTRIPEPSLPSVSPERPSRSLLSRSTPSGSLSPHLTLYCNVRVAPDQGRIGITQCP